MYRVILNFKNRFIFTFKNKREVAIVEGDPESLLVQDIMTVIALGIVESYPSQ